MPSAKPVPCSLAPVTSARPDPDEGWLYDPDSPSAEEIRRRHAWCALDDESRLDGAELDRQKLLLEQWRHLVGAIERLGRLAGLVVDPASELATRTRKGQTGIVPALVAAVSERWTEPERFDRGTAIRSAMGSLAIAAGIQARLDVLADRRELGRGAEES